LPADSYPNLPNVDTDRHQLANMADRRVSAQVLAENTSDKTTLHGMLPLARKNAVI
jgi:hypothetical protein